MTGSLAVNVYADDQVTSGRTTPEQRRRNAKGELSLCQVCGTDNTAATQSLLASDAKYKKFASQVDRCLQSFESVNEWADFISFLSRLLKVRWRGATARGPKLTMVDASNTFSTLQRDSSQADCRQASRSMP